MVIFGYIMNKFKIFYLSGSGTSYHAGLAGQYALLGLTDFTVSLIPASEVPMWINPSATNFLFVPFSQSGESIDILNATLPHHNPDITLKALETLSSPCSEYF